MISKAMQCLLLLLLMLLHVATGVCGEHHTCGRTENSIQLVQAVVRNYYRDLPTPFLVDLSDGQDSIPRPDHRLPGEFEPQRALLFAYTGLINEMPELFLEIVKQVGGRIEIVLLVSNIEDYKTAKGLLRTNSIPLRHVRFVEVAHNTMWARDYGPIIVKSKEGRSIVIDGGYDITRPDDDHVPVELAHLLNLQVVQTPFRFDGGNLLSNGNGLALTTCRLFEDNAIDDFNEKSIYEVLQKSYGVKRVAILEPLSGEPTGHVDMFATFISENIVVIGQYNPEYDPENAAILDRNAAQLSGMQTAKGPLQVIRIPMPPHNDDVWRTYTNVIYANGILLVPTYSDVNGAGQKQALSTYRKLLPNWKVVSIDASCIIKSAGALHCIAMNLGPLNHLPNFPRPRTPARPLVDFSTTTLLTLTNHNHRIGTEFRPTNEFDNDFRKAKTAIPNSISTRRESIEPQTLKRKHFSCK